MIKREQIIEIFEKWQDYVIDPDVYNEVADTILALDEQKESKREMSNDVNDFILNKAAHSSNYEDWDGIYNHRQYLIREIESWVKQYPQQPQKVEQEAKPNKRIMKNIFHVGFMACHGGMELKEANKWFDKTYKIEEEEKPTKRMKSE
jgi:Pyruvate/2-oxoacid:ferredoxin oxidoreductase gamma subunit